MLLLMLCTERRYNGSCRPAILSLVLPDIASQRILFLTSANNGTLPWHSWTGQQPVLDKVYDWSLDLEDTACLLQHRPMCARRVMVPRIQYARQLVLTFNKAGVIVIHLYDSLAMLGSRRTHLAG